MRMVGVRMSRRADLSSRKNGNPWYVILGYFIIVRSWNIRDDLTSRVLCT